VGVHFPLILFHNDVVLNFAEVGLQHNSEVFVLIGEGEVELVVGLNDVAVEDIGW
jgi:hypothetical protein